MDDGWQCGETGCQRDGGDGSDSGGKGSEKLLLTDVQNLGAENLTFVVHLGNVHSVGEGGDVHHVQQGGFGSTDPGVGLDELQLGGNFDSTTGNLGGDTEGLEERGLSGFHASVTSGDEDISGSDGTSTGWGSNSVGQNLGPGFLEVGVGEDEADVA